ncbi:MAG TPA: SEFIR domain-containing protein [Bacteroidia bacterium]|nr:SEFIR domain-containing protein [Bacteroidia bacterium]
MEDEKSFIVKFKDYVNSYISRLNVKVNKTLPRIERDERKRKILEFSYGLSSKYYTNEELSYLLDLTKERVRQIGIEVIKEITEEVTTEINGTFFSYYLKDITDFKKDLKNKGVLSQKGFKDYIVKTYNIDLNEYESYLILLIDVLEFKVIKTHLHLLKDNDLIFFDNRIKHKLFVQVCHAVFLAVEKNTIKTEFEDVIISVKRKLNKDKVPNDYIKMALTAIDDCELVIIDSTQYFQISFSKLSSASDMAYRVLFEENKRMNLSDILRTINHKLANTSRRSIEKISFNQQLNMDKRFVPLGKTGVWTLTEWGEDNLSMYDLITNTLIHFNTPLTKKEIFSHIQKTRSFIKTRSLDTIIYDSRYTQLIDKKFILTDWKDLYKNKIAIIKTRKVIGKENKVTEQIKFQILNLFEENQTETILLSTVANVLSKKFKFPKNSIYKVVSEENEFVTKQIDTYRKQVSLKKDVKMNKTKRKSISVFVSYCWESETYKEKVISFINFLREKGFAADMDVKFMQEESAIDFNRLMHKGIMKYDKVIVLLSESYKRKAEEFDGGVGKEYRFILNDIDKNPNKYILAAFSGLSKEIIGKISPIEFIGREIVDLPKDEGVYFETLFGKLTQSQKYVFSEVAAETPITEQKKIDKFTLK